MIEIRRCGLVVFFFFKQKTAYEIKECDWSSDVCSSDLNNLAGIRLQNSGGNINKCTFTRTIFTNQAMDLSGT